MKALYTKLLLLLLLSTQGFVFGKGTNNENTLPLPYLGNFYFSNEINRAVWLHENGKVNLGDQWEQKGKLVRSTSPKELKHYYLPGYETKISSDSLASWNDEGGVDCIRYRITPNTDKIMVGQEVEWTITADYIPNIPFSWENRGCGDFSIKVFMPEGFVQTGGSYQDFEPFSLRPDGLQQVTRTIKGYFSSPNSNACFMLTKGAKYFDPSYLLIVKDNICVEVADNQPQPIYSKSIAQQKEENVLASSHFSELTTATEAGTSSSTCLATYQNLWTNWIVTSANCIPSSYSNINITACSNCEGNNICTPAVVGTPISVESTFALKDGCLYCIDEDKYEFKIKLVVNSTALIKYGVAIHGNAPSCSTACYYLNRRDLRDRHITKASTKSDTFTNRGTTPTEEEFIFQLDKATLESWGTIHPHVLYDENTVTNVVIRNLSLEDTPITFPKISVTVNACNLKVTGCPGTEDAEVIWNNNIAWKGRNFTPPTCGTYKAKCIPWCQTSNVVTFNGCGNAVSITPSVNDCNTTLTARNCNSNIAWTSPTNANLGSASTIIPYQTGIYKLSCINLCGESKTVTYSLNSTGAVGYMGAVNCSRVNGYFNDDIPRSVTLLIDGISVETKTVTSGFDFNIPRTYQLPGSRHSVEVKYSSSNSSCTVPPGIKYYCCSLTAPPISDITTSIGSTITLTCPDQGVGFTYEWTSPSGTKHLGNNVPVTVTSSDIGIYKLSISVSGDQCTATTTFNVSTSTPPTPCPTSVSIAANGTNSTSYEAALGSDVTLTASTNSGAVTYQWYKGNTIISGATSSSYELSDITTAAAGTYKVTVSKSGCTSVSETININVSTSPTPCPTSVSIAANGTNTTSYEAALGSDVTLTASTYSGAVTYQWYKGNTIISGATSSSYELSGITTAAAGTYKVTVSKSGCTSVSMTITITIPCEIIQLDAWVNTSYAGGSASSPPIVNASVGDDIKMSLSNVPSGYTYTWTSPVTISAGTTTYTKNNITTSDAGIYKITATKSGCTANASFELKVGCIGPLQAVYAKINDGYAGTNVVADAGDKLSLVVDNIDGATFHWVGPNGFSSYEKHPIINYVTQAMQGKYTITVTKGGCTQTAYIEIAVGCTKLNNLAIYNSSPDYQIKSGETLNFWTSKRGTDVNGYTFSWTGPGYTSNLESWGIANVTAAANGQYCVTIGYNGCSNTVNLCTTARVVDCTGDFSITKSDCNTNTGIGTIIVTKTSGSANAIAEYKIEIEVVDNEGNKSYQLVPAYPAYQTSGNFSNLPSANYRVWMRLKQTFTTSEQQEKTVYCDLTPAIFSLKCNPCFYTEIEAKNNLNQLTKDLGFDAMGNILPIQLKVNYTAVANDPIAPTALSSVSWTGPNGINVASANPWTNRKLPGNYVANYIVTFNGGKTKACSTNAVLTMALCEQAELEVPYFRTYCNNGLRYITIVPSGEFGNREYSVDNNTWTVGESLNLPGNDDNYTIYTRSGNAKSCMNSFTTTVVPICCMAAQTDPTLKQSFIFNNPIINCSLTGTNILLSAYSRFGSGALDYSDSEYRILRADNLGVVADWQTRNSGSSTWSNFTGIEPGEYIAEARLISNPACRIQISFTVDPLLPIAPLEYSCEIDKKVSIGETTLDLSAHTNKSFSGYSLRLDGIKDYVGTTRNTAAANNFTVELWVNPNQDQAIRLFSDSELVTSRNKGYNQQRMLLRGSSSATQGCMNVSVGSNGINVVEQSVVSSATVYNVVLSKAIQFTGWTHLAISFNGTTYILYVNGEAVGNGVTTSAAMPIVPPEYIGIGGFGFYKGLVDEAKFWKEVRTPSQINAAKSTTLLAPYPTNLYNYFRFDVINGTTVKNEITGQPNGSITYGNCNSYVNDPVESEGLDLQPEFKWYNGSTLLYTGADFSTTLPTVTTTYTVKFTAPNGVICSRDITVPITLCDDIAVTVTPSQTVVEESGVRPVLNAAITNSAVKPVVTMELETSLSMTENDAVSLGDFRYLSDNFTIEFWAKPSGTTEINNTNSPNDSFHKHSIRPGYTTSTNETGMGMTLGTNGLVLFENGPSFYNVILKYSANLASWNHFAIVYENRKPRLYINGELIYSATVACPRKVIGPMDLGKGAGATAKGMYDNLRLWASARSGQEIKENFDKDVLPVGKCVAFWKFDRSSGLVLDTQTPKVVQDLSEHNRPLTLYSATVTNALQSGQFTVDPKITWFLEKVDPSDGSIRQERVGIGNQYAMPVELLAKGKAGRYNYIVKFVKNDNTICEKRKTITVTPAPSNLESSCFTLQSGVNGKYLVTQNLGESLRAETSTLQDDMIWKRIRYTGEDSYYVFSAFNGYALKNTVPPNQVQLVEGNPADNTNRWKFVDIGNGRVHLASKANESEVIYYPSDMDNMTMMPSYNDWTRRSFTLVETACPSSDERPNLCNAAGVISYQRWENVAGSGTNDLLPKLSTPPTYETNITSFEQAGVNKDNYGTRIRGYICPPETGLYTFWIAGDDQVKIFLSTDDTPANKRLIAYSDSWTNWREYTKNPIQQSVKIPLYKNGKYYIEALHKEAGGGDNVSVRWQLPSYQTMDPIPGEYLSPYIDTGICGTFDIAVTPTKKEVFVGEYVDFSLVLGSDITQDYIYDWSGEDLVDVDNPTVYVTTWSGKKAKAKPQEAGEYIYKAARRDKPTCLASVKITVKDVDCGCTDCGSDGGAIATKNPTVTYNFSKPGYNYVVENTHLDGSLGGSVAQVITYFDGLGRPIQKIAREAGAKGEDIVTPIEYNAFGQTPKSFLPFAVAGNNGNFVSGGGANSSTFYNGLNSIRDANRSRAYSQTDFESSPLNRVFKQYLPGEQAGIGTQTNYVTNAAGEVPIWKFNFTTNIVSTSGTYTAGKLFVTESVRPNGTVSKEYKDFAGQVILMVADGLKTYYVYDDFGQLRCVIPPEGVSAVGTSFALYSTTIAAWEHTFAYNYDARSRMVYKKVPGWKTAQTMTYDTRDRLTSEVLPSGETVTYFYDALNRMISKKVNGVTVNEFIYDTYAGAVANGADAYIAPDKSAILAKGRLVTTKNAIIGGAMLATTSYTDNLGKVIETASQNHTGGTDYNYLKIDFIGRTLRSRQVVNHNGAGKTVKVEQSTAYDVGSRPIAICQRVDDGSPDPYWEPVARHTYDAIGQLTQKTLGCKLQLIDYTYNMAGWTKNINDPATLAGKKDFFGMALSYDAVGNITNQNWNYANRMGGHLTPFKLKQATPFLDTYTYDTRNRLTGHTSAQGTSQKLNLVNAYDDNGNIERLTRTLLGTTVDNLGYTYNGNRLVSINETAVGDADPNYETFKPIASGNYGYDNAGTLTNDPYKGLTITNNFLHLPQQITGASVNVTNTYSSTGQKVKAVGPTGTYDYLGAVVFKNNEIEFVSTPEGRTLPPQAVKQNSMRYTPPYPQSDTTNLFWRYEYTLKDHLGNLRVACRCAEKHTDQQEDHTDGYAPIVVQQTHYDAWGVRLPLFGNDDPNYGKPHDRYRYNGKELVEGIGWYDYGARMYDPTIGRWSAVDPLAEKGRRWSPYCYAFDNPIRFIDPDGRWPWPTWDQIKKTANDSYNFFNKISVSPFAKLEVNVTTGGRVVSNSKTPIPIGIKKIEEIDVNVRSVVNMKFTREEDKNGVQQELFKSNSKSSKNSTSLAVSTTIPVEGVPVSVSGGGKVENTYDNGKETTKSTEYSGGFSILGYGINYTNESETTIKTSETKHTHRVSFFSTGITIGGVVVFDAQYSGGIKLEYKDEPKKGN